MITPSQLKNDAIQFAKNSGNTHQEDINNMVILILSCQLADALNRVSKLENSGEKLTNCASG